MNKIFNTALILILIMGCADTNQTYISKHKVELTDQLSRAYEVIDNMTFNGLKDYSVNNIDFIFNSDSKAKLKNMENALQNEFNIKVDYLKRLSLFKKEYELSVTFNEMIMTEDLIIYLVAYLFQAAQEHDCVPGDWGAFINDKKIYDIDSVVTNEKLKEGHAYYIENKKYLAFLSFSLAAAKENNSEANYNLGRLKYESGLWEHSIDSYKKAIKFDKKNTAAYLGAANAYIQLKNRKKTIDYFDKAIELGSADAKKAKEDALKALE